MAAGGSAVDGNNLSGAKTLTSVRIMRPLCLDIFESSGCCSQEAQEEMHEETQKVK